MTPRKSEQAVRDVERVRIERLREDARRSMSENLREGIVLSHKLISFVGGARPK